MLRNLTLICTIALAFSANVFAQDYSGLTIEGRYLYDACGEKIILRGVSNPNIWFEKEGKPRMAEIAKTGANVVRIVWQINGSSQQLDAAITSCLQQDMIPMVELHDATGDWSKLQSCVDYWVRADVVAVLQKHEKFLLVNIANEVGDYNISSSLFFSGYSSAVSQMRDAGIHVPLVIDGSDWGKNVNILQSQGPKLIDADPDHRLIFSVHMWWPKMYNYTEQNIVDEIAESAELGLPMIVGEFSQMHGACDETVITANNSINYKTIIRECQKTETGYIAWSWFGNCNANWDMSTKGTFATLYDWGLEVAVTDENSIQNTSVRPYSLVNGECDANTNGVSQLSNTGFELSQNFPNPANNSTTIEYTLQKDSKVELTVYDITGKILNTLVNDVQNAGKYSSTLNTSQFENGLYLYQLKVDHLSLTKKMIVLK
ncbi:MAG: T9SS type A sorting domain-containing protein [Prolixibacteraceae bacterium]